MERVELYDTTLRDGTQQEGISLSVEDKLAIARRLDMLGVDYIEGGYAGANPKDDEFFNRIGELELEHCGGGRVRQHAPGRSRRFRRPCAQCPRGLPRRSRHDCRQGVSVTGTDGAGVLAGRKPGHGCRLHQVPCRGGRARIFRRRTLLRRTQGRTRLRVAGPAGRGRCRRRTPGSLRHQRRHVATGGR